jgi:circadian clock protein KaiA
LAESLTQILSDSRFEVQHFESSQSFLAYVKDHATHIDCLVIQNRDMELSVLNELYAQGVLLPIVIIEPKLSENSTQAGQTLDPHATPSAGAANYAYHTGEVSLLVTQLDEIPTAIDRAIAKFLQLPPSSKLELPHRPERDPSPVLVQQQQRLAEKLQERLGYLGVYYKRNPKEFYRNLTKQERQALLNSLREEYRTIILNYFDEDYPLNQQIDQLVNRAFFADLSVSQILEIHMELIDDFAMQLKLEGRSDEILLDYRLALIDIIAHLCEMYRRSIPREDIPFEVFNLRE